MANERGNMVRMRFAAWTAGMLRRTGPLLTRGLALFLGLFSLANASAHLRGLPNTGDIWWIDLSALPDWLAGAGGAAAAVLLVWWAVRPDPTPRRRRATVLAASALAGAAVLNSAAFYEAWMRGSIAPAIGVPASLLYAGGLACIARSALTRSAESEGGRGAARLVAVSGVALLLAVIFPLVQITFFGTTDYRRPADVAVVLGARVHANGVLSTSLSDRVNTGIELYDAGLVPRLAMSGGVGASGVDEAAAMRDRAVALGVPEQAVLLDSNGVNTDATVANTSRMFEEAGDIRRVLVVSQFYHLPRIKLAYRAAGWDVQTVPAAASFPIPQTPLYVLREVPAFWSYWARSVFAL